MISLSAMLNLNICINHYINISLSIHLFHTLPRNQTPIRRRTPLNMKQIVPSFCSSSSLLISLLLAIFLCISPTQSRFSVKIGSDVLSQICAQTEDTDSCLKALQSDPAQPPLTSMALLKSQSTWPMPLPLKLKRRLSHNLVRPLTLISITGTYGA